MRTLLALLLALACAFPAAAKERLVKQGHIAEEDTGEAFQHDTDLVDVPTAAVLDYGAVAARERFFTGGGVLSYLSFGVFQRLNIGASLNVDRLIGSDSPIQLTRPELQVKYRFYDGDQLLPAFAAGFDGQGMFYDRASKDYVERQRGLYIVGSKEIGTTGLFGHVGGNISDFDNNHVFGFLGLNWNIEDKVALIGEWDNIKNTSESRVNTGIRVYATPALAIDFAVREMGRSSTVGGLKTQPERIVQMKYATNF